MNGKLKITETPFYQQFLRHILWKTVESSNGRDCLAGTRSFISQKKRGTEQKMLKFAFRS
jgi:hypothetical protein